MQSESPVSRGESAKTLVDRWFRALDQRLLRVGVRDWIVQVTGIYIDGEDVWIQIADRVHSGASTVLRVRSVTPVEDAVDALMQRADTISLSHPLVVHVGAVESSRPPVEVPLIALG